MEGCGTAGFPHFERDFHTALILASVLAVEASGEISVHVPVHPHNDISPGRRLAPCGRSRAHTPGGSHLHHRRPNLRRRGARAACWHARPHSGLFIGHVSDDLKSARQRFRDGYRELLMSSFEALSRVDVAYLPEQPLFGRSVPPQAVETQQIGIEVHLSADEAVRPGAVDAPPMPQELGRTCCVDRSGNGPSLFAAARSAAGRGRHGGRSTPWRDRPPKPSRNRHRLRRVVGRRCGSDR